MKKHAGFTLIELVIVVLILGLLAANALPRFIDLSDQAKQANIEGMAGGFATGVSLARAKWEADGRPQNASNQNVVNYDGTNFILTTEGNNIRPGYVVGLTDGNDLGGSFDETNCVEVWQNVLQNPPKVSSNVADLNNDSSFSYLVSKSGTNESSRCHYHLKETLLKDGNGDYIAPAANALDTEGNSFSYQPSNSAVVVYININ